MTKPILQRHAIRKALEHAFSEDDRVVLLGEDVGLFGGAFQVTAGMHKNFSDHIIETPISESGMCGVSIGLALSGFKPVLEVMFMDFATQILDQLLNQAVKFNGMYDGKLSVPLLVRTPAGGYRYYGATHSQSLENIFVSVPDLNVVYPHSIQDYYSCLRYLIRNLSSPVMFIENKSLYAKKGTIDTDLVYKPTPNYVNVGKDTLVITYGQAVDFVLEAMNRAQADWTVVDLVSLKPLVDFDKVLSQVANHNKVVVVSESPSYASLAEHVSFRIQEECFSDLKQPIKIVSSKDAFIPARPDKEAATLLSVEDILNGLGV